MAEKDITEKMLEDYNDVFADIVNVLLFKGKPMVSEDELEQASVHSMYKADGKMHELERDTSKYWTRGNVRIALYGMENQTLIDADMPLRIIGYDGQGYREQLLKDETGKVKKDRYPVVTMVLYFGTMPWKRPGSLYDCMEITEELRPFVPDYKPNIFEIAYLDDDTVKMFQSDFRIVADYFVQIRKNKDYIPSKDTIKHVDEVLKTMAVLTKDERFIESQTAFEGGVWNMCEVLDRVEQKGRLEGLREGKSEGKSEGMIEIARNLFTQGISYDIARRVISTEVLSDEELRKIQKEVEHC